MTHAEVYRELERDRAAVRLAGSWRDDRRDVRCKM